MRDSVTKTGKVHADAENSQKIGKTTEPIWNRGGDRGFKQSVRLQKFSKTHREEFKQYFHLVLTPVNKILDTVLRVVCRDAEELYKLALKAAEESPHTGNFNFFPTLIIL